MSDRFVKLVLDFDVKGVILLGIAMGCVQLVSKATVLLATAGVNKLTETVKPAQNPFATKEQEQTEDARERLASAKNKIKSYLSKE